ncbi:MAG: LPS export ABC transporter permease LptG [Candidatus Delongbacteria bacterium]|nr:LPS export ABC transporter permease LptG [Candidatus Delongbacteria bacterium]MCG2760802.1 LPS export ABC transporter permease LptG [Candidatus Delongbacteria bacterium]
MIKILDVYILKKFIITLLMSLLTMVLIYIIIDLFDHLNKFLDAKMPLIGYVLYYTLKIPEIISQIFPVVVFMSLLFTLGNLTKYNEIVAMLSSGISLLRISAPLLILGILLSIGHFFFTEKVVPYSSRKHYESKDYYLDKGSKFHRKMNEFVYQENNSIVYISSFDSKSQIASGVSLQSINDGRIDFRVDAEKMFYKDGKWELKNLIRRKFYSDSTGYEKLDSISLFLDFEPKDITEIELKPIEMGYFELKEYIEKKKNLGADMTKWEVEKMSKLSYSVISLILILIAIPLSTGRGRSSTSVNFGISVGIAFVYYLLIIMFKNWGAVGQINVPISAWTPNIIFGLIGIYLIRRAK